VLLFSQLEMEVLQTHIIKPGESIKLKTTGPPYAWVGFNVIDKALLLFNTDNMLRQNKVCYLFFFLQQQHLISR